MEGGRVRGPVSIFVGMTQTAGYLTLSDIAERLGVQVNSARVYHTRAVRNRRAGTPRPGDLPEPDAVFGRTPVWKLKTIERWEARRPGQGVGGAAARKRSGPRRRGEGAAG